ncbi:hypothetical protein EG68_08944 [Paragonimus skrjabini miyazakii]|uniref:Uncharacterized protein n=1 Tax=Paragonimus skrjabini miyazakii TaxID=59628 RepID=A0A8S9YQZ7_9TREM|nr:hypothetical protein EG68_08944 [Paragonimus skrjabini miyazakii]
MRNIFILKPAENMPVAVMMARGCEATEQLDAKRAVEESVDPTFSQHTLDPKTNPRPNRPAVSMAEECWYCQRFGRSARLHDHNPLTRSGPRKDGSLSVSYEALSSVVPPETVVTRKPLSVSGSSNREAILFLVDTEASYSLIRVQLADKQTKHRRATVKPVCLLAANGIEMRVASSLSARVQLGSFSR